MLLVNFKPLSVSPVPSMDIKIEILLSVHNGEKYLAELLASIQKQTFTDWRLLVRDDGSSDNGMAIVEQFSRDCPGKIQIIESHGEQLGAMKSFEQLVGQSTAPYIAFCDHDDVWLHDKLALMYECMREQEKQLTAPVPRVVHSDLRVVDESLHALDDSYWHYQNLEPSRMQHLQRLLVQNCVTGCAMLANRELANRALPIPDEAVMHDWWFGLVAASCGDIHCMRNQTVLYRQHDHNQIGAKRWSFASMLTALFTGRRRYMEKLGQTRYQAKALSRVGCLEEKQRALVNAYVQLYERGWLGRRLSIVRGGYIKHGFARNLAYIFWV